MNNDIDLKTKLDALEKLRNGAWEEWNNRRTYEWKMSIGIWTALTSFIALVLTGRVQIPLNCCYWVFAIIVIVIMFSLHCYFITNLTKSNRIDRKKQFSHEAAIREILKIDYDAELQGEIDNRIKKSSIHPVLDWSGIVQISVTFLLLIVAFYVVYLRTL